MAVRYRGHIRIGGRNQWKWGRGNDRTGLEIKKGESSSQVEGWMEREVTPAPCENGLEKNSGGIKMAQQLWKSKTQVTGGVNQKAECG